MKTKFHAMALPATEYIPQVMRSPGAIVPWVIVSVGTALFVSMIVAAPLALIAHHDNLAGTLYHSFGLLCHQLPERSFFIAGQKFAVCSRCTGLYLGFAVTLLVYPFLKSLRRTDLPSRNWLIIASIPLLIDFSVTFFGVWENTHATRFLTGLLLGSVTVFYVMPGVVELSLRKWRSKVKSPSLEPRC